MTNTKRKLGIFRVRCVQCEVKQNAKGKPQVEALLEWGHNLQCSDAHCIAEGIGTDGLTPVTHHQLFQWYGDLSPKSAKYTLASLRALVRTEMRYELTRVSELAAAASNNIIGAARVVWPSSNTDAFASVISESFNGEDRVRVEYIYPIDSDHASFNGSPMGPRSTPDTIARIDNELAPTAIESAHARETIGSDGELEEDSSDVVIVTMPADMIAWFNKRNGLRSNRRMRRMAQHIARQVKQ